MASLSALRYDGTGARPASSDDPQDAPDESLTGAAGPLDEYTVEELRIYARDREIDLHGAHRKAEIISAIEAAGPRDGDPPE